MPGRSAPGPSSMRRPLDQHTAQLEYTLQSTYSLPTPNPSEGCPSPAATPSTAGSTDAQDRPREPPQQPANPPSHHSQPGTHSLPLTPSSSSDRPAARPPGSSSKARWREAEDRLLVSLIRAVPPLSWAEISSSFEGRSEASCVSRWQNHLSPVVREQERQAGEYAAERHSRELTLTTLLVMPGLSILPHSASFVTCNTQASSLAPQPPTPTASSPARPVGAGCPARTTRSPSSRSTTRH